MADIYDRRRDLGLAAGLLALVLALHLWLIWVGPLPGDRWASHQEGPWALWPWTVHAAGGLIVGICEPGVALAIAAIGLLLLLRWGGGEAPGLVVACAATPCCALLKAIFGPTPVWAALHPGAGGNFPSGHVVFVAATVGYLGLCAWRHQLRWVSAVALLLVVWAGPERVLSGVHGVSDVIAGYLLAGAFLLVASRPTGGWER